MSHNSLFTCEIQRNEMIRPFLVTGVLEQEYNGERTQPEFHRCLEDAFLSADKEMACFDPSFKELDSVSLSGMQGKWQFCSMLSPQYANGHYYVMEKLALMPIFTVLESKCAQNVTIRFNAKRICVWLNGKIVLNNTDLSQRPAERIYVFEHAVKPNFEVAKR